MISPYDIQQRVQKYVEDSSQYPLIRELINEAINYICQASDKGKDWSFLANTATLPVTSSGTVATATLPPDFRSVIYIEESEDYTSELYGRTIILKIAYGHTAPANITIKYYRAHPPVFALANHNGTLGPDYDPAGADAEWTAANPPASLILLPDEAADAIVYETLLLMRVHEIEVAANSQYCEKVVASSLEFMKSNYQLQIDYRTPISETQNGSQTEELTVGWLVNYGKVLVGGERDEYQLISLVNRIAADFADRLKLRGEQRPKVRNKTSDALPTFGDVAYNNATGVMEPSKKIPAEYWKAAMKYYCLQAAKQLDELAVAEFNAQMEALKDLFFYSIIDARAPISTDGQGHQTENLKVGWLANYINSVLGGERSETQLINIVNDVAAEFANKLKLRGEQRPDRKNALSDDLPVFGDVAVNNSTGQLEAAKKIPASFWIAGAKYQCLRILGKLDELAVTEYNAAAADLHELLFYSIIDSKTPVSTGSGGAQVENLTVGWLANYANSIMGGKKSDIQLINLVNRIAAEFADFLNLRGAQRPLVKNALNDALPVFGDVAVNNSTGQLESAKKIPASFWRTGAKYFCLRELKQLDEFTAAEYQAVLKKLQNLFFYSVIDSRTPVSEGPTPNAPGINTQVENLTVGWLANYANQLLGGEYSDYQLVNLVNRVASEFADKLRLRRDQRPKIRNSMADPLPTFGGVGGFSMSGNTAEKELPDSYWRAGIRYQCLKIKKELDEVSLAEYREMLEALSTLFYSLKTAGVYDYSTYGGMMDYLRTIWRNQKDDSKLWAVLNQTIADVMREINTNQLLTCQEYTVTDEKKNNFSLPNDFKVAIKVTIGDKYEIIGRAFTARGRTMAEQQLWQFPGERRPLWHSNYFSLIGKELVFHHDLVPGMKVKLWYYPKHVWPYKIVGGAKTFDLEKELPIDADLLSHALQAKVAMEEGDMNKYKIYSQDFANALAAYDGAQNRSFPEDARIIAAVPNVDYLLACNTFGFGAF